MRDSDSVPVRRSFDSLNFVRYKNNKQSFDAVGNGGLGSFLAQDTATATPPTKASAAAAAAAAAAINEDTDSLFDEDGDDESYMDL